MSEYVDIRIKNLSLFRLRNYLEKDIAKLFFKRRFNNFPKLYFGS